MLPALLFDLDGTLVDSIELILGSARYAFANSTGHRPTDDEWRATIGRPLQSSIRDFAPADADFDAAFARYREYQLEHHDRLMRAYDGVVDAMLDFANAGHSLALVTSKSDWLARKALDLVGMTDIFPVLVGCDTCTNHKPHPEPVERALALLGVRASQALFVGDSPHDIECGRAAGVRTVGVTWGAFSAEAMRASGADAVVGNIAELRAEVGRRSG